MSRAYVIKNKEGKYWQWLFNHEPDWEDKLYNAFLHYSKKDAEKSIIQWQLKDCEVVEITIAEGDLEQQLAEKDKEIERLKKIKVPEKVVAYEDDVRRTTIINGVEFNYEQLDVINNLRLIQTQPEVIKAIRKQVCDEIRKEMDLNLGDFYEALNKIEQAKESMK